MASESDAAHMRRALALAAGGWGQTAPNPMVGAVVVSGDEVVGEGYHQRFGEAHAEVNALAAAGERARGATLYVTLEPCAHHGKTPPCTDAVVAAGIARVVAATRDPSPAAAGGAAGLRRAGVQLDVGVCEAEARELNAAFMHAANAQRPWITLKLGMSLDGAIAGAAAATGMHPSGWVTNHESRLEVQRMRAGSDAICVGLGTVLRDDPLLTARWTPAPRLPVTRVIVARNGALPITRTLVRNAAVAPVLLLRCGSHEESVAANDAELRAVGVQVAHARDLCAGMQLLFGRGVRSLLVEGGATLAGALAAEALVDRLVIFQAPAVLGAGALNAFRDFPAATAATARRYPVIRRATFGDDLMTVFAITAV